MVKKKESYEDLLLKLEDIIAKMENGDLSLDEAIKYYETGMKTCNSLYKILNEAEGKIKLLSNGEEIDFDSEEKS
ncbi:MAG: exodeoxyribonuclease VII small subunit [Clostridiales bacterium]|nr:exodeoxyribonuclease VII small subunit [Clostridiales bacterium]